MIMNYNNNNNNNKKFIIQRVALNIVRFCLLSQETNMQYRLIDWTLQVHFMFVRKTTHSPSLETNFIILLFRV